MARVTSCCLTFSQKTFGVRGSWHIVDCIRLIGIKLDLLRIEFTSIPTSTINLQLATSLLAAVWPSK
ncbi:hypothetical protein DPEC_G00197320 [Dallia pectoralis]|uniref:Uncharacterized protein n=1 Tax=Dallia pectoralis TaxID=75939 RepID=A0ACC2G7Z2_DALPE|nr:hypothetical protein DPEC_G00197320 [Dallia pectoralis]